ncbi:MAG: SEC-C domain-containing protein [Planctomycetes bacterium]|nr:SEC-C domain-containing protein [Planctomycetota bacterium]
MSPATTVGTSQADEIERLVREELALAGERLPRDLHARVAVLGEAAVPALLRVLEDRAYYTCDGPGEGYGCIHAATLLAEIGGPAAVEPFLRVLERTDALEMVYDRCVLGLMRVATSEQMLDAYASASGQDLRRSLASVLSELGTRDARIYEILLGWLDEELEFAAGCFGAYGDPRAIEPLTRAFDAAPVTNESEFMANHDLVELRDAIERLGGELTPEQLEKYRLGMKPTDRWRQEMHRAVISRDVSPTKKLGRNERCWCGSGQKYKRCHLRTDAASSS